MNNENIDGIAKDKTDITNNSPQYAGFWHRLHAHIIDLLILLPYIYLTIVVSRNYRLYELYLFIPSMFITLLFEIYCVAKYGGSPGKLIAKIKIVKSDFSEVTYKDAFLRSSVAIILNLINKIMIIFFLLSISDAEYFSIIASEGGFKALAAKQTSLYKIVDGLYQIWIWGELIVLLTNKKRRALHDLIAGTVVIKKQATIAIIQ